MVSSAGSGTLIFARQYALFYDALGRQLKAGLPAERALANLLAGPLAAPLRVVVEDARRRVGGGEGVSEALGQHPLVIPRHEARFLQAAEAAGKLPAACEKLAEGHRASHERTLRLGAKLVYPLMVLLSAIWVMPAKALFDGNMVGYLAITIPPTLLAVAAGAGAVWVGFAPAATALRGQVYALAGQLPWVGGALRQLAIARLGTLMALCFDAGLPADQVLRLAADATPDPRLRKACQAASAATAKGQDIASALEAQKGAFPPMLVQVVRTGEEAGKLDESLAKAAVFWQEDADRAVAILIGIAAGAVMGLTFCYVGWLVVSQWVGLLHQMDQPLPE